MLAYKRPCVLLKTAKQPNHISSQQCAYVFVCFLLWKTAVSFPSVLHEQADLKSIQWTQSHKTWTWTLHVTSWFMTGVWQYFLYTKPHSHSWAKTWLLLGPRFSHTAIKTAQWLHNRCTTVNNHVVHKKSSRPFCECVLCFADCTLPYTEYL